MDSLWLAKQFIAHSHKSKAELALALKLPPSSISKMIKGTRQIKATEFMEMRKFFGFDVDKKTKTSLRAMISPLAALNEIEQDEFERKIEKQKPDYDIVRIDDLDMIPLFMPDDHILIDRNYKAVHRMGLYAYEFNQKIFVRYILSNRSNDYEVRDMTPNETQYVPRNYVKILGMVVGKVTAV
jgi:plasmid maintenance system antidote protein VapI